MLPRKQRLTSSRDFEAVVHRGRAWAKDPLVLKAWCRGTGESRFGLSVGRGVGNAVMRNRVKRRLREILRGLPVLPGWDILVSARPGAASTDFQALKGVVASLLQRAGLLVGEKPRATHDGE